MFIAEPLADSGALRRAAETFNNCIGNLRYVADALAGRARYFALFRKPELQPSAVLTLAFAPPAGWRLAELRGLCNDSVDLYAEAQAATLARLYDEAWRELQPGTCLLSTSCTEGTSRSSRS